MAGYGSDSDNPSYLEKVTSTKRKTKEDIRIDQLIPAEILENSGETGIKQLLEYYYKFMNMDEFIYSANETHTDIVASDKAVFRIVDPKNENNTFYTDETGGASTMYVTDSSNPPVITDISLSTTNVVISNGNNLPGTLSTSTSEIGKTFTISGLSAYNGQTATLVTPIKYWVGPGPSYILNAIEESMNIDENENKYLELMQKEIAAAIPRDLTVNKRALYKNITDFYKLKGTQDSIEIFFRLLFNEDVEVEYPWDVTLKPSDGLWDDTLKQYLDHKGFLSDNQKVQDSVYYQKFAYLIRTGRNLVDWKNAFNRLVHPAGFKFFGEIMILTQLTRAILGDNDRISSYTVGTGANTTNNVTNDNEGTVMVPASVLGGSYSDPSLVLYRYKDVYGRTNRKTLSSMPGFQPGVIGKEDLMVLVEMFASVFLPNIIARLYKSATLSTNIGTGGDAGKIKGITIIEKGWGYTGSPPVITITGDNGSSATATCTLDANGSVDTVTITNEGSGYTSAYSSVAAIAAPGTVQGLFLSNLADKRYFSVPTITFSDPTDVDLDGVPLSSNVRATGTVQLDAEGEISGLTITNAGLGYGTTLPTIRIGSPTSSEQRAHEQDHIKIIPLNHVTDINPTIKYSTPTINGYDPEGDENVNPAFRTIEANRYFNRKENSYYGTKKFRDDYRMDFFSSNTIQNTYENVINKYNVGTNINIDPLAD